MDELELVFLEGRQVQYLLDVFGQTGALFVDNPHVFKKACRLIQDLFIAQDLCRQAYGGDGGFQFMREVIDEYLLDVGELSLPDDQP